MIEIKIQIAAARYADYADCLTAAADEYAEEHGLQGWDLSPRWADEQRDTIVLTVPAMPAALTDDGQAAVREFVGRHGKPGTDAEAWFSEAEQAAMDARPGDDMVIEVGAQYAEDGRPHTLALRREWFR